ncbi:hypothetical protein EHS25_004271 [Saitozyma podzolica]|uniref:TPR repeat-containing protein n=1 Tax=Saitozyma podzolica TaxID=1890683 RepID=A0A427YTK1_9TREE|nr:hypothetical protein EHS25_004271 [Saitozyma podzolica]
MCRGDTSQPDDSTPCPSLRLPDTSPPHLQDQCRPRHGDQYTFSGTIKQQCPEPTSPPPSQGRFRISHLFLGLAGVGLFVTIYGLLEYYYALSTWPEPIRTPLKQALKAKNRGDVDRAEVSFRQQVSSSPLAPRPMPHPDVPLKEEAIDAALTLQPSQLQPDPLLKVSGIYISLASMLEGEGRVVDAYKELLTALSLYGKNPTDLDPGAAVPGWARGEALSPLDRLRVIGLEQKLGQLALDISSRRSLPPYPLVPDPNGPTGWEEAAERHLSAAIKAMLKLGLAHRGGGASGGTGAADGTSSSKESHGQVVVGRDLALPDSTDESGDTGRVDKRGLGMTMEHLAEIYARKGQYDVAGQLLLQAVSTLLPPQSQQAPPVRDRCQAAMTRTLAPLSTPPSAQAQSGTHPGPFRFPFAPANVLIQLMTTISSHALHPRTPQAIKASRSWSIRALEVAGSAMDESPSDPACGACAQAKSVAFYNLGMLSEIEGDFAGALQQFRSAAESAKTIGFREGQREAVQAINRVQNSSGSS